MHRAPEVVVLVAPVRRVVEMWKVNSTAIHGGWVGKKECGNSIYLFVADDSVTKHFPTPIYYLTPMLMTSRLNL